MPDDRVIEDRMKLIGLLPVRNEEWCLGLTLRAALMWCDSVQVLLHACTDRSRAIVCEIAGEVGHGRLVWWDDRNAEWHEMTHRQLLLSAARLDGATNIAIIDADEILTGNLLAPVRRLVESTPRGAILQLPGYNLRHGIGEYHLNGIWGNRWFSTAFVDMPSLGWSGDKFHAREPGLNMTPYRPLGQCAGGVMHLWGASEKRLIAKHRLYRVTERIRWPHKSVAEIEQMYSWATDGTGGRGDSPKDWTFAEVPYEWWQPYHGLLKHLDPEAEPWQDAEADRLIAEHGLDCFKGLRI
jgi:hypothetical protein